jgi:hypothetical protein
MIKCLALSNAGAQLDKHILKLLSCNSSFGEPGSLCRKTSDIWRCRNSLPVMSAVFGWET